METKILITELMGFICDHLYKKLRILKDKIFNEWKIIYSQFKENCIFVKNDLVKRFYIYTKNK